MVCVGIGRIGEESVQRQSVPFLVVAKAVLICIWRNRRSDHGPRLCNAINL